MSEKGQQATFNALFNNLVGAGEPVPLFGRRVSNRVIDLSVFASQAESLGLLQVLDRFLIRVTPRHGLCPLRIFELVERILQGLCRVLAATILDHFAAFEYVRRYRHRRLLLTSDYDPPDGALP